ncbi:MAG: LPS export ABC transporter periplasmic protein LptC [Cyanobacteria bacterium SIG26]|nr:LPS export ABC transporter periplasmic protein LptC [Cyanobacteria bacterium SIG26]
MNLKELPKKKRLYLIIALTLGGILAWAFITAGIITHDFNRKQLAIQSDQQEALVNGVILTETKDDQKFWEIYGETGKWDSTLGHAQLNKVIGNFYKDNEVSMSFESSKGTYNQKKGDIILHEDTFIALKDGITLKADKLHWFDSKSPIIAEGHVEIQKGKELISTADKIIISPSYDSFKIVGNTVSKVYEDKK